MLSKEYDRYITITSILANMIKVRNLNRKKTYELENIMERWAQSMMNTYGTYTVTDEKTSFNTKAMSEMIEKSLFNNMAQASRFFMSYCIEPLNKSLNSQFKIVRGKCTIASNYIAFKEFKMDLNPEIISTLTSLSTQNNILRMVMRYGSILPKGQNWSVPRSQYDYLYKRGIRYEAFASPLNSKFMGKKDAKFCSIFLDTDKPFGSIGDFFSINMNDPLNNNTDRLIGWVINPPFIDELLTKSAIKVVESAAVSELFAFYIMPNWTDSKAYSTLSECKHMVYSKTLERNTYYYEHNGKKITASFKSVVFIIYSGTDQIDFSDICNEMMI